MYIGICILRGAGDTAPQAGRFGTALDLRGGCRAARCPGAGRTVQINSTYN